jgi:anti-anti-sigma factor
VPDFSDVPGQDSSDEIAHVTVRSVPGGRVVVTLVGDHDLSTRAQLLQALAGVSGRAGVIFDLTRCTFVDSTIIATILGLVQVASPNARTVSLVLPGDTSYVYRALSVVGVRELMPVHDSLEAALRA